MSSKGGYFLHRRVFPDAYLVQRIPVSRNDLVRGLREHQVADLASGIDVVDWRQGVSVPESNASVSCSTTCGQQSSLVWVPGDRFHSSIVF